MKDWGVETEELQGKLKSVYTPLGTVRMVSFLMNAIFATKSLKEVKIICELIKELLENIDTDGNSFVFKNWYEYFLFLIQWIYPYLPKEKQEQLIAKFLAGLNNITPDKSTKINDNNILKILGILKSGQSLFTLAEDGQYYSFTETTNQAIFGIKSKTKLLSTEQSKDVSLGLINSLLVKPFVFLYSTTKKAMSFVTIRPFKFLYDNIIKPIINPIVFLTKAIAPKNKTSAKPIEIEGAIAEGKENKIIDRISIGIDSSTGIDIKDGAADKGTNSNKNIILTQNVKESDGQDEDILIDKKEKHKPNLGQKSENKRITEKKEQNNHNIEKNNTDSQYQNENLVANRSEEIDLLELPTKKDGVVDTHLSSAMDIDEEEAFIIDDTCDDFIKRSEIEDKNFENLSTKKQKQIFHSLEKINNEVEQKDSDNLKSIPPPKRSNGKTHSV